MTTPARPRDPLPSRILSYLIAFVAVALGVGLRWLLDPWLGDTLPLVTLFGTVAAAVWWGGWRPGLFAAVIGLVACQYLFIEPRRVLVFASPGHIIGTIAYLGTCSVIMAFGEIMRRAQRFSREQREVLRVTLASIGDAVITTDLRGRITFVNAVAETLTGWSRDEAMSEPLEAVFRVVDEQTRQPVENLAQRVFREEAVVGLANHALLIRRDGSERPIDDSAAPIRDERNQVTGCVIIFRDVATRRQLERRSAAELAAASLLASIVTSSHDAIVSKTLDGEIQTWNEGAEHLFGWTSAEAVGRHISLIIPPERLDEETDIIARLRLGERIDHFDTVRRHRDGRDLDVSLTISPMRNAEGRIVGASKIARDISEQKRGEARIRQLMDELQEADRRKDEFLATLAHELRGPLAPLRNSVEVMKLSGSDADVQHRARDTMDRQLTQMERLIEDLLDIARITRNKLVLRRERLDLSAVLQHALEGARPAVEAAKHQVTVELPPEPLRVHGDAVRLAQVFGNLLSNACKYTDPGGHLRVRARAEASEAVVSVQDDGIGIRPDLLSRVFDIFTQVGSQLERARGGLGLGLALVRRLVEMHGGTVEAHSPGLGRGSEFTVRLPLQSADARTASAAPRRNAQPTAPRRILIVDDLRDSAESLAMLLRLAGHQTRLAFDGEDAIAQAQEFRPEVVLLDLGMPRLNGFEACRRIRAQDWASDVLLVAVTGWGQDADRRRSREAGFDAHLVKPVNYEELEELLHAAGE